MNARTLQLLELVGLFDEIYPLGKLCNTSSVYSNGEFISRESSWWESLNGCLHKHFLMLGQSYMEKLLDKKLKVPVRRKTTVEDIELNGKGSLITLDRGETIQARYLIGADGSRSFVRNHFEVPFHIIRPDITWALTQKTMLVMLKSLLEILLEWGFVTLVKDLSGRESLILN